MSFLQRSAKAWLEPLRARLRSMLQAVLSFRLTTSLPQRYQARHCTGTQWRSAFPLATKDDIRQFLLLFVAAFGFSDDEKLRFGPADPVWQIYRDLYPGRWAADGLEFETLAADLHTSHGIALGELLSDALTLGALFAHVQRSRA